MRRGSRSTGPVPPSEWPLRAWVCAVVDLAQAPAVHVAVDLRRRERAVAEQLLDRAQVGAAFEQVRRERVAELVRVGEQAAQRARVEAPPPGGEEEGVLRAARQLRTRLA